MNVSAIAPTTWRQIRACWQALDDKKAENLCLLYVGPQSSITDFFLLASGTSEPHLKALAAALAQTLKDEGVHLVGRDLSHASGWAVVDAFDFVVHLFIPEMRARYQLEQLWKDAEAVDFATIEAALTSPKPKPKPAPRKRTTTAKAKPATTAKAAASKATAAAKKAVTPKPKATRAKPAAAKVKKSPHPLR
jgi:ribosome-associated protein